jgi:hypothetical protein
MGRKTPECRKYDLKFLYLDLTILMLMEKRPQSLRSVHILAANSLKLNMIWKLLETVWRIRHNIFTEKIMISITRSNKSYIKPLLYHVKLPTRFPVSFDWKKFLLPTCLKQSVVNHMGKISERPLADKTVRR